jgi:hypothetical protein
MRGIKMNVKGSVYGESRSCGRGFESQRDHSGPNRTRTQDPNFFSNIIK